MNIVINILKGINMKSFLAMVLFVGAMGAGLLYTPAPEVPCDGRWDANVPAYSVMGYTEIRIGEIYHGLIEVAEPDGDSITVTASENYITIDPNYTFVIDPNDSTGRAKIYTVNYTVTPNLDLIGIHYADFHISDDYGGIDNRTKVFSFFENHNPVIIRSN